ncbi:MAG: pyrimidine dimer DNA glycosylase/endonuclease V [Oligoflexia bacterium]|nr:pyrimidine dimer DNA glycosylase/endonuclease V [Oligoflexia bacterium]
MRIWSLHPEYLDAKGLVALWREALLAQAVLAGRTRGYRHHPQLERFRARRDPIAAIGAYLQGICEEAEGRGYAFDRGKILRGGRVRISPMSVTRGQLAFELSHLREKLRQRDPARLEKLKAVKAPRPHPLMKAIRGGVAGWERANKGRAQGARQSSKRIPS